MSLTPHRLPLDPPPVARVFATYNAYHLGDNLLTLHYLRGLAKAYPAFHFTHAAPATYLGQLAPLAADLPNLSLSALHDSPPPPTAHNAWLGADGWFYGQPDRHDFVAIYLRHFRRLSQALGLPSPFTKARDLLFDYPALESPLPAELDDGHRILVINSAPQSGQFPAYDPAAFDRIVRDLRNAGHIVATTSPSPHASLCTQDTRMDITAIGRLSQTATAIIGVPTGPMWPTFNIWNADTIKTRILLLDTERVDILPEHTMHANHLSLVPELLQTAGLL
jgi:hypothetical protein